MMPSLLAGRLEDAREAIEGPSLGGPFEGLPVVGPKRQGSLREAHAHSARHEPRSGAAWRAVQLKLDGPDFLARGVQHGGSHAAERTTAGGPA